MTKYTYGDWTFANGNGCPVPVNTKVQIWQRHETIGDAEKNNVFEADYWFWGKNGAVKPAIIAYRIATPVPVDVVGERVYFADMWNDLREYEKYSSTKRIFLPTVNGKLVSCKCGMCRVEDL